MKKSVFIIFIALAMASNLFGGEPKSKLELILLSGDGTSFEKAYNVEYIQEELAVINYLKITCVSITFYIKDGFTYDVYTIDKTGERVFFKLVCPRSIKPSQ